MIRRLGRNKAFLRTLADNLTPNRGILVLGVKNQGERLKLAEDLKRHYGCKVEIKPVFSNERRMDVFEILGIVERKPEKRKVIGCLISKQS